MVDGPIDGNFTIMEMNKLKKNKGNPRSSFIKFIK